MSTDCPSSVRATSRPRVGLSYMPESDFREAARPLLEAGEVEVLEWTLDNGWAAAARGGLAPEIESLLDRYAAAGRLHGHGFSFSGLSGSWTPRHDAWLKLLRHETSARSYQRVSEHFGFMLAAGFVHSAPLPVPRTRATVELGRERMARLAEAAGVPVGLENLAIALGLRDVVEQGQMLAELLEPVDGFLVLDVHNLYCQLHNFLPDADPRDLLLSYPLERVTELHVSGGSWDKAESDPAGRLFRRDTHDEPVVDEVFSLLSLALELCPAVEAVFFERIGGSLPAEEHARFRADYRRIRGIVEGRHAPHAQASHA